MRCAVLGPLEVRDDAEQVLGVPGAKERHLLAVLAAAFPGSVTVDQLIESLWDGAPPRTGRKSLQAHVVRLRTALEPGRPTGSPGRYVVRRHDGYALALDRDRLDATAFVDLAARGRALLSAGDAAAADDLLRQALDLWRGRPYADWPDALELDGERERLEGIRGHALEAYWEAELALGRHAEAVPELGRLLRDHPLHEPWWALQALALYRCGRQADALESLRGARKTLADELGVDPGTRLRELEQAILAHDPALDLGAPAGPPSTPSRTRPSVSGCPYKGLARYEIDDAAVFRGRDRLVGTLVTALVDHRLLVVSGSSGAGKSSVIRAGLVPALRTGSLPGSSDWAPVVVTPGPRPVDTLSSLTGANPPSSPVVLVCDQLEQLWSAGTHAGERAAFLDTVLGLLADDVVTRCVLVVRGDHIGRLAEHPDIAPLLHGALVMVPPLSETELRQVVEEPARAAGLEVEPDLTDVAVRDVLGRTGALPLLSTALAETWERRRDGTLTLAGYLATGGVTGAVARSAETAFASLSEPGALLARRILVRLAEQDEHGTLRARRLPTAELALVGGDPALTDQVVEVLVARRLLSRDGDHIEVAHEALLASWPRLAAWLADDAVGRAVRRHLAPAAVEWADHGRPDDELYRGTRLEAAAEWAADPDSGPTELEREFVEAGVALARAELLAARVRAEAESAGRRRTRRLAIVLAAALAVAVVAAVVAVGFQRTATDRATEARAAETVADANRLAALSSSARALDLSLLLAAAAVRTADTPATRDGLMDALVEHRRATGVRQLGLEGVQETALSRNGRTLMATVGGGSPRVLVWRPGQPGPPEVLDEEFWPESLAVSDDGATLVAVGWHSGRERDGLFAYTRAGDLLRFVGAGRLHGYPLAVGVTSPDAVTVLAAGTRRGRAGNYGFVTEVDLDTGAVTPVGPLGHTTADDVFLAASFSDDGDGVVVGGLDGRAAWHRDLSSGRVTRLALVRRDATSLDFVGLPDGGSAQLWADGTVTRYDADGRAVQELDVHRAAVRDVRVLPGGAAAVTTSDDGQVVLWDIDGQGRWSFGEALEGHAGPVVQAEVSADARSLLTASSDGQVVTWDLTAGAGLGSTYPGLEGRYVSNRMEVIDPGRLVVAPTRTLSSRPRGFTESPGADTLSVAAVFLDPRSGEVVDEVVVGDTTDSIFGSSVGVSPDDRWVSVSTNYRATILDAETREIVGRVRIPRAGPGDSTWSPDGEELLVAVESYPGGEPVGSIAVVEPGSWEIVRTVPLRIAGTPQVLEWSRDRETLAVGVNFTASVVLFDRQLREQRTIDLGEGGDVFDLSFSPDGRYLAAGSGGWRADRPGHPQLGAGARPGPDARRTHQRRRVVARQQHGGDQRPGRDGLDVRRGAGSGPRQRVARLDPAGRRLHVPAAGPRGRGDRAQRGRPRPPLPARRRGLAGAGVPGCRAGPDPGRVGQVPARSSVRAGVRPHRVAVSHAPGGATSTAARFPGAPSERSPRCGRGSTSRGCVASTRTGPGSASPRGLPRRSAPPWWGPHQRDR